MGARHDEPETDPEDRDDGQVDPRERRRGADRHDEREDQHKRGAYRYADHHLVRVLNVRHVGRETRHDPGGRKSVDVGKREPLHRVEEIRAQVARESGGRLRRVRARQDAERQRDGAEHDEDPAVREDAVHIAPVDPFVDQTGGQKGNEHFHHDLERYEDRSEDRVYFELSHGAQKFSYHRRRASFPELNVFVFQPIYYTTIYFSVQHRNCKITEKGAPAGARRLRRRRSFPPSPRPSRATDSARRPPPRLPTRLRSAGRGNP